MQAVEEKIVGSGGNFVMQMAPKVKPLPVPAIFQMACHILKLSYLINLVVCVLGGDSNRRR